MLNVHTILCYLQEIKFKIQQYTQVESKRMESMHPLIKCKHYSKKTGVAIVISNKRNFKAKKITRDRYKHHKMIKRENPTRDITTLNVYTLNKSAANYVE